MFDDDGGLPSEVHRGGSDYPAASGGRLSRYAAALSAGLDEDLDQQPYETEGGTHSSSRRPPPSHILCIRVRSVV